MSRKQRPILSFTSHKARMHLLDDIFRNRIEIAEELGLDVCFSCQDDALQVMTDYQKSLVDEGKIELLHIEKDHGSNTKWTLCRMAHPEAVMIVVDDDWIYDVEGIKILLETHERNPEAVVCRAYREIPWIGKEVPKFVIKPWWSYPKRTAPHILVNQLKDNLVEEELVLKSGEVFPEHFLGMLYPPNFPNKESLDIPEPCIKDDDVYIAICAAREGRDLIFAGRKEVTSDREVAMPNALWKDNCKSNGQRTNSALRAVSDELYSAKNEEDGLGEVYLLTCAKYPRRRVSIRAELDRLGIRYQEIYDDGSSFRGIRTANDGINRCHLSKYNAVSEFLKSSCKRMTIIEDDIRFCKDVSKVSKAISTIPEDFGVCRLNWNPSKRMRREYNEANPKEVVRIEKEMSKEGSFWVQCPWATTDGCTIISREVAELYHQILESLIYGDPCICKENSDELLCRVCVGAGLPLYVYKPLLCIQTEDRSTEKGKCPANRFLDAQNYYVPGVVMPIDSYEVDIGRLVRSEVSEKMVSVENEGYIHGGYNLFSRNPVQEPHIVRNVKKVGQARVVGWHK